MKILIVSWYFPPSSTMGALRNGKLARYLVAQGHDIRVVTVKDPPHPQTLTPEVPEALIARTPWIEINRLSVSAFLGRKPPTKADTAKPAATGTKPKKAPARKSGRLSKLYMALTNWPDARVGWLPHAVRRGRAIAADWQPDLVFASGPPFTTLNAGYLIAKKHRIPLVSEFRDRWTNDTYWPPGGFRLAVESRMERAIIDYSCGLVTVSEPWAEDYRRDTGKPAIAILNGYDPKDYPPGPSPGAAEDGFLRISYTGSIYVDRRDPSPLFQALQLMKATPEQVRVDFWGTQAAHVHPLAERFGVQDLVEVHPRVTNEESARLQRASDVLLIMQWDNPKEIGNVPGKLFEYLGAQRPILGLGPLGGVPATIVKARDAGLYCNEPEGIADQLERWLEEKRQTGQVAQLPDSARAGYTRDEQYQMLERFLLARGGLEGESS
ncbi:MAG: glycosyltransferase [Pseudomonadota bacterium]